MSTIVCPVCGRRIATAGEAGAPALCPGCGASLLATEDGRDDSDTRPVPLEQFPTRPVGPASGETRDLPASALPSAPSASRAAKASSAPGRVGWLGAVALVALLVALLAGAALAVNGALPFGQQAASPTATVSASSPSATPATITYSQKSLYSIAYPTGWHTTERNNPPGLYSASFINPVGGASLTVTAQQTPIYIDAATVDTDYLKGLAFPTGTKPKNVSKPEAQTLAGQTWTVMSADVALATSVGRQYAHAVVMTVNHGGYVYTIVRLVPVVDQASAGSAFAVAEQESFQPMLATFAFLG